MSSMLAAIKKRKTQMMPEDDASPESNPKGLMSNGSKPGGLDLKGLVANLSQEQKQSLLQHLAQDQGGSEQNIAKGGPSKDETAKVQEAIAQEDSQNSLEEQDEAAHGDPAEEDEIAKSMLESRHMRGGSPAKRGLNDRVQSSLASKLKSKGKI